MAPPAVAGAPDVPAGTGPAESPTLRRVGRGDLCAGCGACAGIAPRAVTMRRAAPGFLRPDQTAPLTPAQEDAIAAACPGLGQAVDPAGRTDDALWGPWVAAWTGHATDAATRHAGASGGALTAILAHLMRSGTVDAVVTNAPDPERPLANRAVIVSDPADLAATAGSRYAPSAPLALLPLLRRDGRRFAVVGKPCDAAALAALRASDPGLARAVPVVLSFFCAGVPSEAGAREVLRRLGAPPGETVAFRYRGNGWPGRATATTRDGTERSMSYHDSWGGVLSRHVQTRCKLCADGTGTAADIVCADAWETDAAGYPLFDDAPGRSLILARTSRGRALVDAARSAGAIAVAPFDMAALAAIQPGQRERRRALVARLAALRLLGRPAPRYRGLGLWRVARQNRPDRLARNFVGTLRRVLRQVRA